VRWHAMYCLGSVLRGWCMCHMCQEGRLPGLQQNAGCVVVLPGRTGSKRKPCLLDLLPAQPNASNHAVSVSQGLRACCDCPCTAVAATCGGAAASKPGFGTGGHKHCPPCLLCQPAGAEAMRPSRSPSAPTAAGGFWTAAAHRARQPEAWQGRGRLQPTQVSRPVAATGLAAWCSNGTGQGAMVERGVPEQLWLQLLLAGRLLPRGPVPTAGARPARRQHLLHQQDWWQQQQLTRREGMQMGTKWFLQGRQVHVPGKGGGGVVATGRAAIGVDADSRCAASSGSSHVAPAAAARQRVLVPGVQLRICALCEWITDQLHTNSIVMARVGM
jgi:hypothetical protein